MNARPGATRETLWGDADDEVALHRYRTLVDTLGDGIYQLDPDGRFVAVNDVVVDTTGYSRDELLGNHVSLVFAADDVERVQREVRRSESNDDTATVELAARTADGETIPWELRVSPLVEDGEFRGSIGVARDLSGRRRPAASGSAQSFDDSIATALDEAQIGVFVLDETFEVAWANETVGRYFGLDQAELVGRDKRQVVREVEGRVADPDRFAETILATYDDNSYVKEFECHVTGADDREERWLEHRSEPIESGPYAGGRIEFYYDVTDRRQSSDALRESEERFQSLVDAVEEYAIFRLDPDGHVVSWNEGAKGIKGYEPGEILGEHFSTFYTQGDRAAGVPERNLEQATERGSVEDEGWRVREDGTRFWANVTITAVRDDDGTHRGFLKVTRDTTDRHRREQELESELQRILDRVSDAFYAVDEDFQFTHVNERAEELLQRSEEELLGESLWDVFPYVSEAGGVEEALREAMDSQESATLEFYYDPFDLWVEANLYPSETGLSVYFRDVTGRREYERKLEESNERLEQFAYAASHDLQEPLRMVSSYLQLIERRYGDEFDEDGREFLEFAVDGAERMRDMIDGLLEYSRVESKGDPFEPVELDDVLGDVREVLRVKIAENDAEITAGSLPRVQGDAGQLRQLFQNLLDNAIEYSGDESPGVHVSAERREADSDSGDDGDQWVISVRDEGIGIDPDDAGRVFEIFQSLHGQADHRGTGIGLALCERIVERHGGEIWVDSEPGEGTTVSFTLPAAGDGDE